VFEKLIEELKKNPGLSKQKMKVKLQKVSRFKINVRAGRHKFVLDEDKAIGGTGEGPSPAELLLTSIGGCLLSTMEVWSNILKIKINSTDISVKGTIDVMGMLGIDDKIPSSFQEIKVELKIISDEPDDKINNLIEMVEKHCPVYNTIVNPIKIKTILKK